MVPKPSWLKSNKSHTSVDNSSGQPSPVPSGKCAVGDPIVLEGRAADSTRWHSEQRVPESQRAATGAAQPATLFAAASSRCCSAATTVHTTATTAVSPANDEHECQSPPELARPAARLPATTRPFWPLFCLRSRSSQLATAAGTRIRAGAAQEVATQPHRCWLDRAQGGGPLEASEQERNWETPVDQRQREPASGLSAARRSPSEHAVAALSPAARFPATAAHLSRTGRRQPGS